jgi:hypothetical protein
VMLGNSPRGMSPDSPPLRSGHGAHPTAAAAAAAFARLPADDTAALAVFGGGGPSGLAGLSPLQQPTVALQQSGQQLAYQTGSGVFLPQAYSINLGDVDIAMLGRSNTITPLGSFGDLSSLLQSTAPLMASDLQALVTRSSPLTHRFSNQQLPLLQGPPGVMNAAVQAAHPGFGEGPTPMDTATWQQQQRVHRVTSDTGQGPIAGRMGSLQQPQGSMSSWGQQQVLPHGRLQSSLSGAIPAPAASGLMHEGLGEAPFGGAGLSQNLQPGAAWFPGGGDTMQRLGSLHSHSQQHQQQQQQGRGGFFEGGGAGGAAVPHERYMPWGSGMQGSTAGWPGGPGAGMAPASEPVLGARAEAGTDAAGAGSGPYFGVPSGMAGGFGARRDSHASGSDRPLFGGYGGVPALGPPMFGQLQPSQPPQPQQHQPPAHQQQAQQQFGLGGMPPLQQPGNEAVAGTSHLAPLSEQPRHQHQHRQGPPPTLTLGSAGTLADRTCLGDGSLGNLAGGSPPGPPEFGLPQSPSVLLLQVGGLRGTIACTSSLFARSVACTSLASYILCAALL